MKPWNLEKAISLAKRYTDTYDQYKALCDTNQSKVVCEPVLQQLGQIYISLTGEMCLWNSEEMRLYKEEMKRRGLE